MNVYCMYTYHTFTFTVTTIAPNVDIMIITIGPR